MGDIEKHVPMEEELNEADEEDIVNERKKVFHDAKARAPGQSLRRERRSDKLTQHIATHKIGLQAQSYGLVD